MKIVKPLNTHCAKCGVEKTTENTPLRRRVDPGKLYYHAYCHECNNELRMESYEMNKEEQKARMKERYRNEVARMNNDNQ